MALPKDPSQLMYGAYDGYGRSLSPGDNLIYGEETDMWVPVQLRDQPGQRPTDPMFDWR